jgi:hypothetical protein
MNHYLNKITLATALLALPLGTQASELWSDNFESYTAGDSVPARSNGTENWRNAVATSFDVVTDSSNIFSSDSNQYAEMTATGLTSAPNVNSYADATTPASETGQLSFSFYDPSTATHAGFGWSLRIGSLNAGNSNTAFGIFINDGSLVLSDGTGVNYGDVITTYTQDAVQQLDIVFNNSISSLDYGTGVVASGTMDVYLNGVLVGDDLAGSGGLAIGETIGNINFTAKTSEETPFSGTLYLDDLSLNSSIAIPEPSSAALLLGLAVLLPLGMRYRSTDRK